MNLLSTGHLFRMSLQDCYCHSQFMFNFHLRSVPCFRRGTSRKANLTEAESSKGKQNTLSSLPDELMLLLHFSLSFCLITHHFKSQKHFIILVYFCTHSTISSFSATQKCEVICPITWSKPLNLHTNRCIHSLNVSIFMYFEIDSTYS